MQLTSTTFLLFLSFFSFTIHPISTLSLKLNTRFIFGRPEFQSRDISQNRLRLLEEEFTRLEARQPSLLASVTQSIQTADLAVFESQTACRSITKSEQYQQACIQLPSLDARIPVEQARCEVAESPASCFEINVLPDKLRQVVDNLKCNEASAVAPLLDSTQALCSELPARQQILDTIATTDNPAVNRLEEHFQQLFQLELEISTLKESLMMPSPDVVESTSSEMPVTSMQPTSEEMDNSLSTTFVPETFIPEPSTPVQTEMPSVMTETPSISESPTMEIETTSTLTSSILPDMTMTPEFTVSAESTLSPNMVMMTPSPMVTDSTGPTDMIPAPTMPALPDVTQSPGVDFNDTMIASPLPTPFTSMDPMITPVATMPVDMTMAPTMSPEASADSDLGPTITPTPLPIMDAIAQQTTTTEPEEEELVATPTDILLLV